MKSTRTIKWRNWFTSPEFFIMLAVIAVAGPLIGVSSHNATASEIQVIKTAPMPQQLPAHVKLAEFQVCKPATGSCAQCHTFIPGNPPGCGGLAVKPPVVNVSHPVVLTPEQRAKDRAEILAAHPGAMTIPTKTSMIHDIPLPTCFPCPDPPPVGRPGGPAPCTDASCTGMPDNIGTLKAGLVADFPPPTCLPCQPALLAFDEPIVIMPPAGPPSRPWPPAPCTDASCTGTA